MATQVSLSREIIISTIRKYLIPQEDTSQPIQAALATRHLETRIVNLSMMQVRESLGQRVKLRLTFECLVRHRSKSGYRRMHSNAVTLDCPNSRQAELAIEAILSFAQSLDGLWLSEPQQNEQDTNKQAISTQSAGDLQRPNEPLVK